MESSKYLATTIALLMIFSSVPLAASAFPAGVLTGTNIGLHGPYLDKIKFSVITDDATLYNSLTSGTIQGPEWPLLIASFYQAAANPNLYTNTSLSYGYDGVGFNVLRPVMSSVHFRQAIQYLTDYGFIEGTVLSGVLGAAAPDILPCQVYPAVCDASAYSQYSLNLQAALDQLKLVHGDDALFTWTNSSNAMSSYSWLYNGQPFTPKFDYRVDDPLRTGIAQSLIRQALKVGLTFNAVAITRAGGIFHAANLAVTKVGEYNPATGYNSAPVFDYGVTQNGQADDWDMYTFGWGVTPYYTWTFSFFNSSQVGNNNFGNYYNTTMDYYTNQLYYATDVSSANAAGKIVSQIFAQQLPYIQGFYQENAFSVYLTGWTGYVYYPGQAQLQSGAAYFSFLNLHPTAAANGGTYNYALHQAADPTGMNPLYQTNWQWQADIYSEVFDAPLLQDPMHAAQALAFAPWEVTSYNVASFSGATGSGAGWYNYQAPTGQKSTAQNIVSGQVITMDFWKNITFFDHVQMTARDLNFSLDIENVAGNYPDSATPTGLTMSGPAGLISSYISPSNPFEIKLYINSSSVWNIANVGVLILPQHIFRYFNPDTISTATAALDTSLTFDAAAPACQCFATGVTVNNAPAFLHYLYNLDVGNGPFWLKAFDSNTGAGELDKNVNYYRAAWWAGAPTVGKGTPYSFTATIAENIYNPAASTWNGVASHTTGTVPVGNATGTVTLWKNGVQVGSPINLVAGSNGQYTAQVSTSSLAPGLYETVVNATYTFLGLHRMWFQAGGLTVGSATTQSTTTSSTGTTTATDYTPYIYGAVIVVIIIIIVVAMMRRRGAGGK